MKNFKTMIVCLTLASLQVRADLPESSDNTKEKVTIISLHKSTLKLVSRKMNLSATPSSFTFAGNCLNAGYVSGLQKKERASSLSSVLKWDLKFKFKLNRNMNIIFSYN